MEFRKTFIDTEDEKMNKKLRVLVTVMVVFVVFYSFSMVIFASDEGVLGPVTEIVTVEGADDVEIVTEVITGEVIIEEEAAPLAATVAATSTGISIMVMGIVAIISMITLAFVIGCIMGRRAAEW